MVLDFSRFVLVLFAIWAVVLVFRGFPYSVSQEEVQALLKAARVQCKLECEEETRRVFDHEMSRMHGTIVAGECAPEGCLPDPPVLLYPDAIECVKAANGEAAYDAQWLGAYN